MWYNRVVTVKFHDRVAVWNGRRWTGDRILVRLLQLAAVDNDYDPDPPTAAINNAIRSIPGLKVVTPNPDPAPLPKGAVPH